MYTTGFIYKDAHFGQGAGLIAFSLLECIGNEMNLVECPSEGQPDLQTEVHSDDVGVSCMELGES